MATESDLPAVLRPLMTHSGGVEDPKKFEKFQDLLKHETDIKRRHLLMTILELTTTEECLKQLVENEGLLILNSWLQQARDAGVADAGAGPSSDIWKLAAKIIDVLKKLPVTVEALTKAEVGKTVRSLTKLANAGEVRQSSKDLITQWKARFVKQQGPSSDAKKATAKRQASGQPDGAPIGKKPPQALQPASDDSLFASKPAKPVAPREARPYAAQRRKVQRMEDLRLPDKTDAARAGAGEQQPETPGQTSEDGGVVKASVTVTTPVGTSAGPAPQTTAVERPRVVPIKIATVPRVNPFANLTITMPATAAERAEAAAARVERELADLPAPAPRDPNKKRKTVSWAEEAQLIDVRTFSKDQPPVKARSDVELEDGAERRGIANSEFEAQHRQGFLSAAKREHTLECHHMTALHEAGPWTHPPPQILFKVETRCASGEQSQFFPDEVQRIQNVAEFTAGTSDPKSRFAHNSIFEPKELSAEEKQAAEIWITPEIPWNMLQYQPQQQQQQQYAYSVMPQQQMQAYGQPQYQHFQQQQYPLHQQQNGHVTGQSSYQQMQQYPSQHSQHFGHPTGTPAPPPPPRPKSDPSKDGSDVNKLVNSLDPSLQNLLLAMKNPKSF